MPSKPNRPRGWYWVQDMHGPARPGWWDGTVFLASPADTMALAWHWPSFRVLCPIDLPTDAAIQKWAEQTA